MTDESTKRLPCGHCNIEVDMKLLSTANHSIVDDDDVDYGDEEHFLWELYLCPSCKKPTLVENFADDLQAVNEPFLRFTQVLYPQESTIERYIPNIVYTELTSALKVKNADNNAFAVLIRRTLEQVCTDKKASGNTLYEQLEDLSNKNLIPETLAAVANKIRSLGNVGAHSSKGSVSKNDVEVLHALLNSVLEYLYRAPALIEKLEKSLDKASD